MKNNKGINMKKMEILYTDDVQKTKEKKDVKYLATKIEKEQWERFRLVCNIKNKSMSQEIRDYIKSVNEKYNDRIDSCRKILNDIA